MARIFGAILVLFCAPLGALGQEAQGAAGGGGAAEESTHLVVGGETLWGLAFRYYGDPFHWPTIYEANRSEIEDPHWIYPTESFVIPGAPNQPPRPFPTQGESPAIVGGVAVQNPGASGALPDSETASLPAGLSNEGPVRRARPSLVASGPEYRTVFYDSNPLEFGHVYATGGRDWLVVPRDAFYASEWVAATEETTPRIGWVMDFQSIVDDDRHGLSAKNFDRLRVTLPEGSDIAVGDQLVSFRADRHIEGFGTVVRPTGQMIVSRLEADGAVAVVTTEFDRIRVGDMIDRLPSFDLESGVYPSDVSYEMTGTILAFGSDQELYGHGDIAFVSIGGIDGLTLGDELEVRPPADVESWTADALGRLQVLRVQENVASARIIGIDNPVFTVGARVRLVRKMPR
ncbi:MAG: LysM peptidoglycan-binding domain-containing protein [Longimicrobiales bacterium]